LISNTQFRYDESFISSALAKIKQTGAAGSSLGTWFTDQSGLLCGSLFTQREPGAEFKTAAQQLPILESPESLLGLCVLRRDLAMSFIQNAMNEPSEAQAAVKMFEQFRGGLLAHNDIPMVIVSPIAKSGAAANQFNPEQLLL
jgi:hypothetical protein